MQVSYHASGIIIRMKLFHFCGAFVGGAIAVACLSAYGQTRHQAPSLSFLSSSLGIASIGQIGASASLWEGSYPIKAGTVISIPVPAGKILVVTSESVFAVGTANEATSEYSAPIDALNWTSISGTTTVAEGVIPLNLTSSVNSNAGTVTTIGYTTANVIFFSKDSTTLKITQTNLPGGYPANYTGTVSLAGYLVPG